MDLAESVFPKFWKATDLKTGVDLTISKITYDETNPSITFHFNRIAWIVKNKQHNFITRLKRNKKLPVVGSIRQVVKLST